MWTIVESSADRTAHLPDFDEPLVLGPPPRARFSWRTLLGLRTLAGLMGVLALSAALAAQIAYFYQDYFLRHTQWRTLAVAACERLGCTIPPEKHAEVLRHLALTVDPHPDYQQMLLVSFRAQNTASYPLAFPNAELSFRNISGELIAQRRFSPAQFLDSTILREDLIAPGAQISGALELTSPAAEGVNYTLEFVYDDR